MNNRMNLEGKTVAVVATHGFEQSELLQPLEALKDAGARVHVIAPETTLREVSADSYDALVLPGGVMNPDTLRMREDATKFIRDFFKQGKPVSAICHGPQILIDCGVLEGREITSYPSIKLDLKNAGARWTDQEVVVDKGLTTSRTPDDLPAFIDKTIEEIREGVHSAQATA